MVEKNQNGSVIPIFKDRTYVVLKYTAQIVLPALATFYLAVAQLWGLPKSFEIVGTITALNVLLGTILGLSTRKYNNAPETYDGQLVLPHPDSTDVLPDISFVGTPDELASRDKVSLKVVKP